MNYGNYAPFYRAGFFNPMQAAVQPLAETQAQMIPQYQPTIPQAQTSPFQPVNDMIWVLNENEATSYPVAPNNTVTLWDKNEPTIYIKSVNAQGVPAMRILDFKERVQGAKKAENHECTCGDRFVSIEQFKALELKFDELSDRFEGMNTKAAKTAKSTKGDAE